MDATDERSPPARCCVLCGSEQLAPALTARDFEFDVPGDWQYARCQTCNALQLDPMPPLDALTAFYPSDYGAYATGNPTIKALLARYFANEARQLTRLAGGPGRRVLDIGCGDGSALEALSRAGDWEGWGIEIDPAAAAHARRRGFRVFEGTLESVDLPEGHFHLIRLGHVIEHVPDPRGFLRRLHRLLHPGGLLHGETPNTAALDRAVLGRYWGGLHAPRHLVLFDTANLRAVLQREEFEEIRTMPRLAPVGWTLGLQNLLRERLRLARPQGGRYPWYLLLLPPFTLLSALQYAARRTGIMAFQARRPRR